MLDRTAIQCYTGLIDFRGGFAMLDEKDKLIYDLEAEIRRLNDENRKLEETVKWMHELIWQMVKERESEHRDS